MTDIKDVLTSFYNQNALHEWERMERHRTEFAVTLRALQEHLPPPPAKVLDCGGGPGRYAIELSRRGYKVCLFDLAEQNLELAAAKAQEAGVALDGIERGDAVDLSRFPDDSFEAILLMGPLYHLLDLDDRLQALREAYRVLKPGGALFATFISRYSGHRDTARNIPEWVVEQRKISETLLNTGRLPPRGEREGEFVAYFSHPKEVEPLVWEARFEVVETLGLEGLVSFNEDKVNTLEGQAWETWVDLNYRVAHDPSIFGLVEHLLVVSRKPAWRKVALEVVSELNRLGIPYTIAGGASVILQGLRIPLRDLDFETSREGAYRFQEVFQERCIIPVSLSQSQDGIYRSHFGRFDFDGVKVEVMGENHRHQGDGWTPTWTSTSQEIELEGSPVKVSWIEEETLAYIRRGRLERAAGCLALCDKERLLALLRREIPTNVF